MKYIKTLEQFINEQKLNEAQHIDINWCLKTIKSWNKDETNSYEELSKDIIKHLGFKTSNKNIEIAADHLAACEDDDGKVPEDGDIIKELIPMLESVNEAVKFPAGKFDDDFKKLITDAQKKPNWEDKPDYNRTTATHTVSGKYNGTDTWFEFNIPGAFGPIFVFKGLSDMKGKSEFTKTGEKLDNFLNDEITKIAKEKNLRTTVPMVWLLAAKNIPDNLIKDNHKEFEQAIKSISK